MIVQLLSDDRRRVEHEFKVPHDQDDGLGSAGEVVYRGRSYRFSGMAAGRLMFIPSDPTFELKEEWAL